MAMKKLKKMKKRILSALMISCMCITMLPQGVVTVSAANGTFSGGAGTVENPYRISSVEDLEALADAVNDGNSYAGQYFKLTQDIDLSEKYNKDKNESWVPIGGGQKNPFSGTFDGGKENGYQITGLYMDVDADLVSEYRSQLHGFTYPCFGLFGYVQDGVIQNLSVDGDISAEEVAGKDELGNHVGGIVGYNKGTIKECEYDGTITTRSEVESIGGIVGYNGEGSTIEHCTNDGDIEITEADSRTPSRRIGGIVGTNNGTVRECGHTGSITCEIEKASYKIQIREIGGIVGGIVEESTIEHCTNDGDIKITKITADYGIDVSGIGGIVGGVSSEVKDCHNTGNITVEFEGEGESANIGGISGSIDDWGDDFIKVTGCTNTGEIKADKGKYVGGISASIGMEGILGTMIDCRNEGTVQGSSQVGGIAGYARNTTIKKCYNHGEVTADGDNRSEAAGGILGLAKKDDDGTSNTAVESCYNWGNVKGPNYVGGIVGEHNGNKIENCYNVGSVTGENVGGIGVGNLNSDSENYYLDTCLEEPEEAKGDGQTPKNEIQFQFGEVAFLLQNGQTELDGSDKSFWGQQLTGDEIDQYPVFTEDANKKVHGIGLRYEYNRVEYEGYANPDGNAPLPDASLLSFPGNDVTMEVGRNNNRTTFKEEGEVTLPGGGKLWVGDSSVTAPDSKATIGIKDKETVTLPRDVTVELENGDIELGLPDGGVMDKDGTLTMDKDGRFVIKGTTVTVPEKVVIEPDEKGNIELLPGTRAELSSGEEMDLPKGGVIDRNGNVTPYGGEVEVDIESGEGAPEITVPEAEDLDFVLDNEDRKAVAGGRDIKILFTVESIAAGTVSAGDAEKIKTAASYYEIGSYLDISLYKRIMVNEVIENEIPIYETDQLVSIGIEIPTDLKKSGRTYAVVRLHEGEATRIEDMDDNPDTVTIETDRFSTYVIVYTDLTDEDWVHTHTPGTEWKADEDGHWNICTKEDCPDKEEQLNYSEHSWDNGKVTKEPTEESEGEKTYTCSICGRTKTETLDKLSYNPGNVEKEAQSGENAPKAELPQKVAEIQEAVFTEEDQRDMEQGKDIKILLTVEDASNTVKAEEKQKIAEGASYYTIGQYLDINLIKVVTTDNDSEEKKVTNTKKPIRIVIDIPENLKGNGKRTYAIVRLHNGEATLLEDLDDAPDTVTIETDRFSTYAMVYTEITDADRVAEAQKIVEKVLSDMTVTNDTTKEGIQQAIDAALKEAGFSDVTATVGDLMKIDATGDAEGSIVGTVTIKKGEKSGSISINKTIAKLPQDDTGNQGDDSTVTLPDSTVITPEQQEKNEFALNEGLKVDQKGKKINVSWGKVTEADGYQVYVQYCSKKFSSKPTKEVKSAKTTKVTVTKINGKKLNLKKNYKVYVTAYKLVNGKKVVIGKTITAHIVGKNNKAYTNVKQIKVSKSKYTLEVGRSAKIQAKTVLVDKKKKQLSDKHAKELRYKSTDTGVAVVSAKGKITAKGKGTCTIYVYARNGYAEKVKVTVK